MGPPIKAPLPKLETITLKWNDRGFSLPYFYRSGTGGPSVLFAHGLGGCKENFYAALQSPSLADCTLLLFDQPGTGLASFDPNASLNVSALADITQSLADALMPEPHFLAGASMGGLITLLQIRRYGFQRLLGLINIEGNLCPEDCMFSRRVIPHTLEHFSQTVFHQMAAELRKSPYTGDQIVAQNMLLNVDIRAYHTYSFETVVESDSGRLLHEFLDLPLPKLFLYGEANKNLSYLPRLRSSNVSIVEIPSAAHFLFYDNPVATFQTIGDFVHRRTSAPITS
jgi:pimeloyl-ACP methyl ester carboxylesterase